LRAKDGSAGAALDRRSTHPMPAKGFRALAARHLLTNRRTKLLFGQAAKSGRTSVLEPSSGRERPNPALAPEALLLPVDLFGKGLIR